MEEPSESAVRDAVGGDLTAFELLVRHYQAPVWRFLCHLLADPVLAEDVTQEVFVRLYRRLPTFAFRSTFSSWVFQVARNAGVDALRSRARRERIVAAVTPLRNTEPHAPAVTPAGAAELDAALASLSHKTREALLLVEIYGLTYREAAVVLDTAEGTVKSRVHHARQALHAWLDTEERAHEV